MARRRSSLLSATALLFLIGQSAGSRPAAAYVRVCALNHNTQKTQCFTSGNRGSVCDTQTCVGFDNCTCTNVSLVGPGREVGPSQPGPTAGSRPTVGREPLIRQPDSSSLSRHPTAAQSAAFFSGAGYEIALQPNGMITANGQPLIHVDQLSMGPSSILSAQVVDVAPTAARSSRRIPTQVKVALLAVEDGGQRRWYAFELTPTRR